MRVHGSGARLKCRVSSSLPAMATNAAAGIDPGVIDAEALSVQRVLVMNDEVTGLRNFIHSGNLSPGVTEAIQQAIRLTKFGVALISKVNSIEGKLQSKVNSMEGKLQGMADDTEAKLAAPVAAKLSELEVKRVSLTNDVQKAIAGIGEEFQQRGNQSFMDMTGLKSQQDNTAARLSLVESQASSMLVKLQQQVDHLEGICASAVGNTAASSGRGNAFGGGGATGSPGNAGSWQSATGHGSWARSAMEHKAVMNLKVQGNDRQGYRMWHEKLTHSRKFMCSTGVSWNG